MTRRHPDLRPPAILIVAALMVAAACAKNPVTGRRQMMLITEEQEFAIGEGADAEIRKEYGAYLDSPALRDYVDRVGTRIAEQGERPGLVFHFEILNTPEINAFALPGGFVYVTRGMLERLSSEDDLAMVLGHEIAHVTARHGAARISALYAMQYGSLIGAMVSPRTFVHYNDLIGLALQVGMSKYSREQEGQADRLGVAYAARCGYNPESGVNVMEILQWLEAKEPGAVEKWFRSHPPASERIADIEAEIGGEADRQPGVTSRPYRREDYLRNIDGLVVGLHNGAEMVLKDRYYNKELAASLSVPAGWEVDLDRTDALVVMSEGQGQYVLLEATPVHRAETLAEVESGFEETLRRRGWRRTGGSAASTRQGVEALLASYEGRTARGEAIGVLKAFLLHGKRRWVYTAVTERQAFEDRRAGYEAQALDLAFLGPQEAESLAPPRLGIRPAEAGDTWASLAAEHLGDAGAARRLAFYNGRKPDAPPETGFLLKIPPSLAIRG